MPSEIRRLWSVAGGAGLAYGISLRDAPYPDQAIAKVLMCGFLALAAVHHARSRERFWLCAALAASAAGDALLAMQDLPISFVGGLGAFLAAHLAYCALLAPLRSPLRGWRRAALPLLWAGAAASYAAFFPQLHELAAPVGIYTVVLCSMASLALFARLPSIATSLGGLIFVASDTMIGIDRFLEPFTGSTYAIWFSYAAAQLLITAGILSRP
ncbi:lysoplasmalogenase [Trinickia terrae]|uniref:Lysoplasmalogenase n=1 Tax=Trinickia terrae TaxID=2571161 RepID=A0A4U1HRX2_9BURK|nr:lysoplasmalogenase [Trinickia terrae]TKC82707.1 lysoplasmalogenase [Trinickia terrae]